MTLVRNRCPRTGERGRSPASSRSARSSRAQLATGQPIDRALTSWSASRCSERWLPLLTTARVRGAVKRSIRGVSSHTNSKVTRVPPSASSSSLYVPRVRRRPSAPTDSSLLLHGGCASTTAISIQSARRLLHPHPRSRADAAWRARVGPVDQHVIRESLVVREDVEETVDLFTAGRDRDRDADGFHVATRRSRASEAVRAAASPESMPRTILTSRDPPSSRSAGRKARLLGLHHLEAAIETALADPTVEVREPRRQHATSLGGPCVVGPRDLPRRLNHHVTHNSLSRALMLCTSETGCRSFPGPA